MSLCMSLHEYELCSLKAWINQINGLLGFLRVNMSIRQINIRNYVSQGNQDSIYDWVGGCHGKVGNHWFISKIC